MLFPFPEAVIFFAWAFLSAALEVNIEGPHGWAKSLPTWRRERGGSAFRVAQFVITGGRPFTGYHLSMFSLQILALHLCYAQGVALSWRNEAAILSVFFLICPTWDFLWFVLNPAYGLKKFAKDTVEWHGDRWWPFGKFPVDYGVSVLLSIAFAVLAAQPQKEPLGLINMAGGYFSWALLTYLTSDLVGPWYRRRRVRLLAGNDPPHLETNVDGEADSPEFFLDEDPPA